MASQTSSIAGSTSAPTGGRAQVLYDGQCPLCLKSVAILKRLDWFHGLDFVNARDQEHLPAAVPVPERGRLLEEMHLLAPDGFRIYHGFEAFRWMTWRLPLLWPLVPLLYVPGVPTVGQRAYLWIARNRFQLVPCHGGICTLHPGSPAASRQP